MSNTPATKSIEAQQDIFLRYGIGEFSAPTPLMIDRASYRGTETASAMKRLQFQAHGGVTEAIGRWMDASANDIDGLIPALWAILLARYSSESRVLFGIRGVGDSSQADAIAPMILEIEPQDSVADVVQAAGRQLEEIAGSTIPPLSELKSLSSIAGNTPLLESVVCIGKSDVSLPDMPLQIAIDQTGALTIAFQSARFSEPSIRRLAGHLQVLLAEMLRDMQSVARRLPLLTREEQEQMLVEWNQTEIDYPDDKCLHELFEEQVAGSPDAIAVVHDDEVLTYSDLNVRANRLAHFLRKGGAGPGKLVAISLQRGFQMPIAMMAVAKSGAAYVPLDPDYPSDRLAFMLDDTEAAILVTESALAGKFAAFPGRIVEIDTDWPEVESMPASNPESGVGPMDLAYVIYTSGSTGRPKGAVLNHQGRVNNFADFNRRYDIGTGDRLLALASISFDMSVYDVYGTLMCGGCIVMADATAPGGPAQWARLMTRHDVTVWHSVPALLEMLVDYVESRPRMTPNSLRLALLGGDWIPVALPDRLRTLIPGAHVVSMGGATEVSMDSTIYDIDGMSSDWKSIPYGFPMANQRTYVLDPELQPLPIGVPGELHLGGVGVGEGYWKREELTAEKFIPNPFIPGERIYKTGDLARFGPDGNLELLGRIDFQVKIRGFRIELGEIESVLRKHPQVREGVVLAKDDAKGNKRLVAYVLPDRDAVFEDQPTDEHVAQWADVYDTAYSSDVAESNDDPAFNIVSWNSSYTDLPYPADVMQVWVDSTVERIMQFGPKDVLEIGCGTGLLLLRIAPHCETYTGLDISSVALDYVSQEVDKLGLSQVSLDQRSATELSGYTEGQFDTVILNSVILNFPNERYLTDVLTRASRLVRPGGTIFVGDVRDIRNQELLETSVHMHKTRSNLACDSLRQIISRAVEQEEELLVDPTYFFALQKAVPGIGDVEIPLERGRNDNEMSKFRYDAILHVSDERSRSAGAVRWIDWVADPMPAARLQEMLDEAPDGMIGLRNVRNARLQVEVAAQGLLQSEFARTVRELRREERSSAERVRLPSIPRNSGALATGRVATSRFDVLPVETSGISTSCFSRAASGKRPFGFPAVTWTPPNRRPRTSVTRCWPNSVDC